MRLAGALLGTRAGRRTPGGPGAGAPRQRPGLPAACASHAVSALQRCSSEPFADRLAAALTCPHPAAGTPERTRRKQNPGQRRSADRGSEEGCSCNDQPGGGSATVLEPCPGSTIGGLVASCDPSAAQARAGIADVGASVAASASAADGGHAGRGRAPIQGRRDPAGDRG